MFKRACAALPALRLGVRAGRLRASIDLTPDLLPLSKETMMLLGKKGMDPQAPIFIRVFKEESELEVWKQRDDGRFYHFKTYPICNWSGELGPKVKQGDKQAPEGFYTRHARADEPQLQLPSRASTSAIPTPTTGRCGAPASS